MLDWRRFGLSERECMHQLYSGVSYQQLFFCETLLRGGEKDN